MFCSLVLLDFSGLCSASLTLAKNAEEGLDDGQIGVEPQEKHSL